MSEKSRYIIYSSEGVDGIYSYDDIINMELSNKMKILDTIKDAKYVYSNDIEMFINENSINEPKKDLFFKDFPFGLKWNQNIENIEEDLDKVIAGPSVNITYEYNNDNELIDKFIKEFYEEYPKLIKDACYYEIDDVLGWHVLCRTVDNIYVFIDVNLCSSGNLDCTFSGGSIYITSNFYNMYTKYLTREIRNQLQQKNININSNNISNNNSDNCINKIMPSLVISTVVIIMLTIIIHSFGLNTSLIN